MKTSLEHLPSRKQDELRLLPRWFGRGAPLDMLILFGSHARGDWVEDPEGPDGGYVSDYDMLPRATPEEGRLYDLLRRAYIDARYDKSYRITEEELATLGERMRAVAKVVERVCREKIASLRAAAATHGAG